MTSNTIEISEKLQRRIAFLSEIEKLKVVYRQNSVINGTRAENSAEHSWHIAIMAMLLLDHSDAHNIDILKVMKMLLIHDIVEIDHGDVFLYDKKGNETKDQNERLTARRIFAYYRMMMQKNIWIYGKSLKDATLKNQNMPHLLMVCNHF
jgi:putative hydrolase of HD superfamily